MAGRRHDFLRKNFWGLDFIIENNIFQVNILGCQIVGAIPTQEEWIFQCKQLNTLVDTEPFIYTHPDITEEARQRSLECRRRGQPRLLTGLHFYLMGGFDSKNLSKADLARLIVWAGAKVISRYSLIRCVLISCRVC